MQLDLLALLEPTPQEILADVLALGDLPGPANRERTVAAWRAAHQPYIVASRNQHPWWLWELHIIAPGARWSPADHDQWRSENPGIHIPTVLSVDRRNAHDEDPTGSDEEHIWYRAACLGCDYEGSPFTEDNQAIEEAHDHTHPWWRDLPVIERPKSDGTAAQQRRCRDRLAAIYEEVRPGCTSGPYPPIRTWRDEGQTRHHTGNALGGYDLGVPR